MVKFEVTAQGYAIYTIKVVGPRDISFHIKDRYSSLREFQAMVKRTIGSTDGMPSFPKKRLFGNTEAAFLQQRSQQLSLKLGGSGDSKKSIVRPDGFPSSSDSKPATDRVAEQLARIRKRFGG